MAHMTTALTGQWTALDFFEEVIDEQGWPDCNALDQTAQPNDTRVQLSRHKLSTHSWPRANTSLVAMQKPRHNNVQIHL